MAQTLQLDGIDASHFTQMRSEVVVMTPEKAQYILDHKNGKNRSLRKNVVTKLANDIKENRWRVTHQGIAFDENEQLIDGQHRLQAIAQAGKNCLVYVSYNVSRDCFSVLDCGVSRTASDNLSYANVPRAKIVAPGIKHIILYKKFPAKTWNNLPFPTHAEIQNFYDSNFKTIDQLSELVQDTCKKFKKVNPTGLLVVCFLAAEMGHNMTSISSFCHGLGSGIQLAPGNPILAYRQFLINSTKIPTDRNLQQYSTACLTKLFNYWVEDKSLKQFKAPSFPSMPVVIQALTPNTSKVSSSLREEILKRDNYTCQQCGATKDGGAILEVDHIFPRSKGGTNDKSNLQCLCSVCNQEKLDFI